MADNGNPKKNAAASIAFAWGKQTALQGTTSRKWTSSIEVNSALSLVLSTIIGKKPHHILGSDSAFLRKHFVFIQSKKFAWYYFQISTKQLAGQCWSLNLNVKQQPPGVFDHILDAAQEEDGLSAIDQPVVICQGEVHHRPCEDVAVHNHRALHNGMHPKNR